MRALRRIRAFVDDDNAQAMTEYVIVLPVVLLMFFAVIQTGVIIQAGQLANYAAFSAARSYATSYSLFKHEANGDADKAHNQASQRAKNAAALVMAPVSHAQTGEALSVWQPIRDSVAAASGSKVQDAVAMVEGYLVAALYRIQNFSITPPDSDTSSISTVFCSFEYWVPISIPGLVEIWNYMDRGGTVGAHKDTHRVQDYFDIESPLLGSDLNEQISEGLGILENLEQWVPGIAGVRHNVENHLLQTTGIGLTGSRYNIHLPARCRMGFEPWNGQPIVGSEEGECEAEVDEARKQCVEEYKARQDEVAALEEEMDLVCDLVPEAERLEEEARAALQTCRSNPITDCSAEYTAWREAVKELDERRAACKVKTDAYNKARQELDNADAQDCLN